VRTIWLLIKAITAIALIFAGAVFALRNDQLLSVDFILFQSVNISLGLWLLIFLALGVFLGMLASSLIIAFYRRKLARLRKETQERDSSEKLKPKT
jgi:putative membrane protein